MVIVAAWAVGLASASAANAAAHVAATLAARDLLAVST
jgi:hypothetical protein